MATYYWVGGSGTWDTTNTANWASTSGGSGGAGCPTSTDDVIFDSNSGSPLTINSGVIANSYCRNCTVTNSAFFFAIYSGACYVYGSLYLTSGAKWTRTLAFNGTNTGNTIYAPGVNFDTIQFVSTGGGDWTMTSDLSVTGSFYLGALRFIGGGTVGPSLTTNGYTLYASSIGMQGSGTLNIGSGTVTIGSSFYLTSAYASVTGTGTLSMIGGSAKSFEGGGYQGYPTVNQGGAGTLTFTGSNKFANITNTYAATGATTVKFTGGTTNEFTDFNLSGTSGKLCALTSTTTTQASLKKSTTWFVGANSTNSGNNNNVYFLGTTINYLNVSYINGIGPSYGSSNFFLM